MSSDSRLESYLFALDKALGNMPLSQRIDILAELKTQILSKQSQDPNMSLDQILASLGQPEQIARRYNPHAMGASTPATKNPVIKWLVLGFLGTFLLFLIFITVIIFRFAPFIEWATKDINNWDHSFDIKVETAKKEKPARSIVGSRATDEKSLSKIFIPFRNGKFLITYNTQKELRWECDVTEGEDSFTMAAESGGVLTLDLDKIKGVSCELSLPQSITTEINGANGDLKVRYPQAHLNVSLGNGRVQLAPDFNKFYDYNIRVKNGKADFFKSVKAKESVAINIEIQNGFVQREQ